MEKVSAQKIFGEQALSSLTNGMIIAVMAGAIALEDLGQISLAYLAIQTCLTIFRGTFIAPMHLDKQLDSSGKQALVEPPIVIALVASLFTVGLTLLISWSTADTCKYSASYLFVTSFVSK